MAEVSRVFQYSPNHTLNFLDFLMIFFFIDFILNFFKMQQRDVLIKQPK